MRTTFTKFKYHQPRAASERITIPRKEGGRGVTDIAEMHTRQIVNYEKIFPLEKE